MDFGDPEFVADFGCHLKQDFGQDRGKSFLLKSRCKRNLAIFADQFVLQFQTGAGRAQQVFGRLAIEVARMEHGDFQSY